MKVSRSSLVEGHFVGRSQSRRSASILVRVCRTRRNPLRAVRSSFLELSRFICVAEISTGFYGTPPGATCRPPRLLAFLLEAARPTERASDPPGHHHQLLPPRFLPLPNRLLPGPQKILSELFTLFPRFLYRRFPSRTLRRTRKKGDTLPYRGECSETSP